MTERKFTVRIGCEGLGKVELFRVKSRTDERAWRMALDQFFRKHPQALRQRLSVGGSVRRTAV